MAYGIEAPNLTITGTGNLNVKAADMTAGGDTKSYGVLGNVKLKDSANAAFAGGKAAASAGLDGALVAEGSSHLTATGGAATAASYGLNCGSGAAPMLKDDASVTLTAGDAPTSNATNAALDLSGHNAYHWRISSADKWTNSTTAPYAFAASDAYVEVESGTVPVPTPPSSSTSTSTSTPVPTSTPNDVSGQDTGSQAKSLANTGDGSLTMPLALLVSALVATIVLVAFQLRRVNRRGEKRD